MNKPQRESITKPITLQGVASADMTAFLTGISKRSAKVTAAAMEPIPEGSVIDLREVNPDLWHGFPPLKPQG